MQISFSSSPQTCIWPVLFNDQFYPIVLVKSFMISPFSSQWRLDFTGRGTSWQNRDPPSSVLTLYWGSALPVPLPSGPVNFLLCCIQVSYLFLCIQSAEIKAENTVLFFQSLLLVKNTISKVPLWIRIKEEPVSCLFTGLRRADGNQPGAVQKGLLARRWQLKYSFSLGAKTSSKNKKQPVNSADPGSLHGKILYFINAVLNRKVLMDVCFYAITSSSPPSLCINLEHCCTVASIQSLEKNASLPFHGCVFPDWLENC